ncbi:MAG: ATP-binding protein [Alphaproteobacteria bacterium]
MTNSDVPSRSFEAKVFWRLVTPFVLAVLIVTASAAFVINLSARAQDRMAAESSRTLVRALVSGFERDLDLLVYDNSWWNVAFENLVETLDKDWADDNIGTYAADTHGLSESFVLSPNNKTKIAYVDGVPSLEDARSYFGPALDRLVQETRASSMFEPVPASGYFLRDGELHLVSASALTLENPMGVETERHVRHVLVYGKQLSATLLDELSAGFGVDNLHIVFDPPPAEPSRLSASLAGPRGAVVAWLTWNAPRPGSDLLAPLRIWRAVAVAVVVALSLLFVRQVLRMARRVADHSRQLAEKDHQLAQSSKLALLGEMAAGVVHELNQPLNIIRMATEQTRIKFRAADAGPEGQKIESQLEIIAGQTERMAETVQSMRIFSRDDYGRKLAFDPTRSVAQAVDWLRPDFEERGVVLDIGMPAQCGRVFGEPSRFEQVIVNLLINARDAVEANADGSVTSDPSRVVRVTVSDDPAREMVNIAVRDNGQGIPVEHIDRVFEPFFTTKEPGAGTGLGLSISYGIVSGMNGTLLAENTGDGAEFRIELPRIMPADVAGASAASMELE